MSSHPPLFVTFEGTEGAGKSTALKVVAEQLRSEGIDLIVSREPGAGDVGGAIREILLHGGDLPPRSELLLFLADRANHIATVIEPALALGQVVLCDRHADSTLVYQGFVRGLDEQFVRSANAFATDKRVPDLTLFFDLPVEIGLSRLTSRDRMDAQPLSFHLGVREGFLRLMAEEPNRFVRIDAAQDPARVAQATRTAILERLMPA